MDLRKDSLKKKGGTVKATGRTKKICKTCDGLFEIHHTHTGERLFSLFQSKSEGSVILHSTSHPFCD